MQETKTLFDNLLKIPKCGIHGIRLIGIQLDLYLPFVLSQKLYRFYKGFQINRVFQLQKQLDQKSSPRFQVFFILEILKTPNKTQKTQI